MTENAVSADWYSYLGKFGVINSLIVSVDKAGVQVMFAICTVSQSISFLVSNLICKSFTFCFQLVLVLL